MTFSTKTASGTEVSQTFAKKSEQQQQHFVQHQQQTVQHQQQTVQHQQQTVQHQQQFVQHQQQQQFVQQQQQFVQQQQHSVQQQQHSVQQQQHSVHHQQQQAVQHQQQSSSREQKEVVTKQVVHHGEEIKQESLKSTIQSAITDLEQDLTTNFEQQPAVVMDNKENQAPQVSLFKSVFSCSLFPGS